MTRVTEKLIALRLKRWSLLRERAERIDAERNQLIEPIRVRFEQKCAPIDSAAEEKLAPISAEMRRIEAEVEHACLNTLKEDGSFKFTRVDTATAVAEILTRPERELDSKKFWDNLTETERNSIFHQCVKTLLGKAEQFLGKKRVAALCHTKKHHSVSIKAVEKSA